LESKNSTQTLENLEVDYYQNGDREISIPLLQTRLSHLYNIGLSKLTQLTMSWDGPE
jgi:hypothetical protein